VRKKKESEEEMGVEMQNRKEKRNSGKQNERELVDNGPRKAACAVSSPMRFYESAVFFFDEVCRVQQRHPSTLICWLYFGELVCLSDAIMLSSFLSSSTPKKLWRYTSNKTLQKGTRCKKKSRCSYVWGPFAATSDFSVSLQPL
jgi:hypothetical protein